MITILTATYNREHTLSRLFDSLCAQSCMDFEWVVVDDGSVDNTLELLKAYSELASFKVNIIHQTNSGKHVALNNGVAQSTTPWIYIVDSDDAIVTTAVQTIYTALSEQDGAAVGLCYRKAYFDMRLVGRDVKTGDSPLVMSPTEAGHLFKGDLAYVFKTEVFKKHKFPVFANEKFVPELYIWNKIADEGKVIFYGETILYLCDYLEDGYSKNFSSNLRKNPNGFLIFYWSQINRERILLFKVKYLIRAAQCFWYRTLKRLT
ncbi:glycosyltransferase family A protein [Pseudomonas sp. PB3P13]